MKIKLQITGSELNAMGLWDKYCELAGVNIWAMNEGLLDGEELLDIDQSIAAQLGLIPPAKTDAGKGESA